MKYFDDLYLSFGRDEEIARKISSPNAEDTQEIKMAIVGFSYNSATADWEVDELDFVAQALSRTSGATERERLFYALSLGFLLGLSRAEKLSAEDFKVALAQIPGFILLKGGKF